MKKDSLKNHFCRGWKAIKCGNLPLILVVSTFLILSACGGNDNDTPTPEPSKNGFYIVNEGPFGSGTGTVSYYDRITKTVKNDLFGAANSGAGIGNILQSVTFFNGKAYCVANNANRIIVADSATFKYQDSLVGFTLPRFVLPFSNQKMYVSEWGAGGLQGSVKVYNPETKKTTLVMNTGKGAERMLRVNNGVWVVNNGGFAADSSVVFIDLARETVTNIVKIGLNPNSLVEDANGGVWVLCGGTFDGRKPAELILIKNGQVDTRLNVAASASNLVINAAKNRLYFIASGKIWEKDIAATPPSVFLEKPTASAAFTYLYGLAFDAKTQELICSDAKNFTTSGTVYIFNAASKSLVDSAKVGIAPNGFAF